MPHESSSSMAPHLHPAEAAWRKVSADPAEVERVEMLQKSKKASVYRLVRRGEPPVIAKRYVDVGALFERTIYEEILGPAGVSRLAFYGALGSDGDHGSWSFMEDAGGVTFVPADEGHRREVASWLGELHAKAAPLVARQPRADQCGIHQARLTFAREAFAQPPIAASSPGGELAYVARVLEAVRGAWDAIERVLSAGPVTLVHGDFGPKNIRVRCGREGQRVVAYDWEMAVVGNPAVDLWWLSRQPDSRSEQDYRRAATAVWRHVPRDQFRGFARVGFILRLVDCIYWSLGNLQWQLSSVMRWSRDLDAAIRLLPDREPSIGGALVGDGQP